MMLWLPVLAVTAANWAMKAAGPSRSVTGGFRLAP